MNRLPWLLVAFLLLTTLPMVAKAGQGPHNVAIVINERSPHSVAVARKYAHLRGVPTSNLIYLDWKQSPVGTGIETFRQQILHPILQAIDERGLDGQITTIAYSADFPYVIDYKADLREGAKVDPTAKQFHQGSLTGLTYLAPLVLDKDVEGYTNLASNYYYRTSLLGKLLQETRDFPCNVMWNQQGLPTRTNGRRYYLSTMLAYTSGRGNSLVEVERYLKSSLRADGTYPAGKIYFLTNTDVRTRTRSPQFRSAVTELAKLGVAAEVVDGILPRDRLDVMGAMIGTVDYRFADSGSRVRDGAICENLTSFGGILRENGGQTALTECLRAGSAGSSGTVTEPYAIQAKFPHPFLHLHYARGCCLAEAFYQAVQGPYQLLIVGDPLARPWATIPTVSATGLPGDGQTLRGELSLAPTAVIVSGKSAKRFELYVDGRLHAECLAGATFDIDSGAWPDGEHELRIIAYEDTAMATQGEWIRRVVTANHGRSLPSLNLKAGAAVKWGQPLAVEASAPDARKLSLFYCGREIATSDGANAKWDIRAQTLGLGCGTLQVVASFGDGPLEQAVGNTLLVEVLPSDELAAVEPVAETKPGVRLVREGKPAVVVPRMADDWLAKAGVQPGETIQLEGYFQLDAASLYQWQLDAAGEVEVQVDGQLVIAQKKADAPALRYGVVSLSAGTHRLEVTAIVDPTRRLNLHGGNCGTQAVAGGVFHHVE